MDDNISITKLAKIMNISASEVSRAFKEDYKMNEEKRAYILKTAKEYGYTPNRMASRLTKKAIKIGVILAGDIKYSSSELIRGIHEAHDRLFDYKVVLDLKVVGAGESSAHRYCELIDELVEENCNGIVMAANDEKIIMDKITEVTNLGIPIAGVTSYMERARHLFTCTGNAEAAAELAAQMLSFMIQSKRKNILLITGDMKSDIHQKTARAFFHYSSKYGITITHMVDTLDESDTAYFETKEVLESGEIDGIYITTANCVSVCRLLHDEGYAGKIKVITTDMFDDLAYMLENDVVHATIYQDLYKQARRAFMAMFFWLAEKRKPEKNMVVTPQLLFKSNYKHYQYKSKKK